MTEPTIKQMLQTMSLDGIEDVVQIIRSRPDIFDIMIVTNKEQEEMTTHFQELMFSVKERADEPA